MADKVLLITAQYIKDNSIISENVDVKYISNTVVMCQDINLHELIGTDLFNEIKSQVVASTLTALNTTLLDDYIQPYLLNLVLAEIIIPATYKITNKSVVQKDSEAGTSVDSKALQLLKSEYDNKAQFYGERLRKYLLENSTSYPLYLNGNANISDIRPSNTAYNCGIYLGNVRRSKLRGKRPPGFTDDDRCCE